MRPVSHIAIVVSLALSVPAAFAWEGDETPPANPPGTSAEAPAAPEVVTVSPDGRRTTRKFVPNLGRNLVGMFSKETLAPLAIGTGATLLALPFDDNVQRYFTSDGRKAKWLGDFADQLGKPYILTPLAAALYGIGRIAPDHQRFREGTYDVAQAFLVNAAYMAALKVATQRERPDGSDNYSFPSGHTSNAFAWATVGNHYYGLKLGIPGFAFATLIGVGRMEKNAHHLTDVVAGAALGVIVGRTVTRRDSEPLPGAHAHQFRISPQTSPSGDGVGLTASLQF